MNPSFLGDDDVDDEDDDGDDGDDVQTFFWVAFLVLLMMYL